VDRTRYLLQRTAAAHPGLGMLHGAFNLGRGLRHEARRSHASERARQIRKKREVGVKREALKAPHP
jgi:hypothetical protein